NSSSRSAATACRVFTLNLPYFDLQSVTLTNTSSSGFNNRTMSSASLSVSEYHPTTRCRRSSSRNFSGVIFPSRINNVLPFQCLDRGSKIKLDLQQDPRAEECPRVARALLDDNRSDYRKIIHVLSH